MKFDSSGTAICGTTINNINDDANEVVADPLGDNVYFDGDVENALGVGISSCAFGDTTLYDGGGEWAFMTKWTCTACKVSFQTGKNDTICEGQAAELNAMGGIVYSWMPPTGLDSINVSNPIATPSVNTVYTVNIKNDACSAKDSISIIVKPLPVASVCCDTIINVGSSVSIDALGGKTYTWVPANGLSCSSCSSSIAMPVQNTTYTVTITSDSGCSVSRVVTIDVSCHIFIPQAFSPNNDGQNDYLYVRGDCVKSMDFMIFDRWGNKVFETTDQSIPWDGRYKGEVVNTGTYVYYFTANMYDGSTVEKKGNVTLVR